MKQSPTHFPVLTLLGISDGCPECCDADSLFWDLGDQVKCLFNTLVCDLHTFLQLGFVRPTVKSENVVRALCADRDQRSRARPDNLCMISTFPRAFR